jgi:GntR family transcriptional regulator
MQSRPASLVVTEPVYKQLARVCRKLLRDGSYKPGAVFPSERELATKYKVSRATANKVISNLVAEGLLLFRPGLGTVVQEGAERLCASLREMKSFTHQARAIGWTPETEVLLFNQRKASELDSAICAALGLENQPNAHVFEIKRLRKADTIPAILEHRWLIAEFTPKLTEQDVQGSLYEKLEQKYGLVPSGERLRIRARALNTEEADLMLALPHAPTLEVSGVGLLPGDRPLWYQILLYRADRYELMHAVQNFSGGCHSDISFQPRNQKN